MTTRLVPVGLLTSYLREVLEADGFLADVWVEGEISNFFPARSGHVYFTLRGDDSQLKCALFRQHALRQPVLPGDGDLVAAHGSVSFYEREGTTQLYVDLVQPAGLGLAALQLERLRQQLAAEGLFDPTRKRPLPPAPRCIGVVTSPDGAVWHDIQQVLRRRYPLTHLILSPATVQGERAPATIVAALEALQHDGRAEVIILARGGGSAEDLAAFNDERVARAIFACRVPVVSGVGHETDFTLADEVADVRAPTPSVAAEVCVPAIADLTARIADHEGRLTRAIRRQCEAERIRLHHLQTRLRHLDPGHTLASRRQSLRDLVTRAARSRRAALEATRGRYALQVGLLAALNPTAVLQRGYAVLSDPATGAPISRAAETAPGAAVRADLADGTLFGRIHTLRVTSNARPERSS